MHILRRLGEKGRTHVDSGFTKTFPAHYLLCIVSQESSYVVMAHRLLLYTINVAGMEEVEERGRRRQRKRSGK